MTKSKVTILVENTVGVPLGLLGEWGLSMLLDFGDEKILFDAGEQGNLVNNAQILGCDLRQVDKVVLSHGHYDHTGGLYKLLQYKGTTSVYAHPNLFAGHFAKGSGTHTNRYIGVPYCQQQLEGLGASFHWHSEPFELRPGLWLSGEILRESSFEHIDDHLVEFAGEQVVQDSLKDDLSMFYVTNGGLIILLGCAHSGLVNIVEQARQITKESKVRGIIGGTHLGPASAEQRQQTIDYLKSLNLECLAPNHCTGSAMLTKLATEFPKAFRWAMAGVVLEF